MTTASIAADVADLADLAEAAYVDFGQLAPRATLEGDDLARALATKAGAWPQARRDEFIKHWRVVGAPTQHRQRVPIIY
ncbi:hypothetical protein [Piscinibacterium candidicorallinum]|uniref:Uncharacterized protein n=1 Tax=Piscinibacterium candidicorallinum TaxID=1793872 RepID=A0ABV7GXD5_9BURK